MRVRERRDVLPGPPARRPAPEALGRARDAERRTSRARTEQALHRDQSDAREVVHRRHVGDGEAAVLERTAQPVAAAGLKAMAWTESAHQVGGPTQAGADCAAWCRETFRVKGTLPEAIERAGAALREHAPLFLPYLAGERAPVWSSGVRGAFHRVDRAHTPDDFLWSTMEGVAHAVRDILALAQSAADLRAHELRACGGGARSDAWCALKADVLGIPVIRTQVAETGLVGAAMAAAVGLGLHRDLRQAAARMVRRERRFAPRARFAAAYAARAAQYDAIKRLALALPDDT